MNTKIQSILDTVRSFDLEEVVRKNKTATVVSIMAVVIITDLFGFDAFLHKLTCTNVLIKINNSVVCTDYFDIPIWSFFEIFGVIGAVIVAVWTGLWGIRLANQQEKIAEETRKDESLPILVPVLANNIIHPDGNLNVKFQNSGKGIAKNIVICFGDFKQQTDISIAPSSKAQEYNPQLNFPEDFFSQSEIEISYEYEDIYDRTHKTTGVIFRKSGNNFTPHSIKWKFEKNIKS